MGGIFVGGIFLEPVRLPAYSFSTDRIKCVFKLELDY